VSANTEKQECRRAAELRRHFPPCPFERGATEVEVPFHYRIIGNLMVYQDRLKTNLLQLFAQPENSECFFIISAIIFEINIVAAEKQA